MFTPRTPRTRIGGAASVLELIYHNTVRSVRQSHANAILAILLSMLQVVVLVLSFFFMFHVLGLRGVAIRGDFILYIMSGIFLYLVHIRTVRAVFGAQSGASGMLKHAPMNTAVTITAAALSTLYIQVLSMICVLFIYHAGWGPISIHNWAGAFGMLLMAWFTGIAIGLILLAMKPWAPELTPTIQLIYTRASMIASGKMFVANSLPGYMVAWFDWNPLFHSIDQARGFVFINYFPHNSNTTYPLVVSVILLMVGLMGEFYTRRSMSVSWGAGR